MIGVDLEAGGFSVEGLECGVQGVEEAHFPFFGFSWALRGYCRVIALKDLGFTVGVPGFRGFQAVRVQC